MVIDIDIKELTLSFLNNLKATYAGKRVRITIEENKTNSISIFGELESIKTKYGVKTISSEVDIEQLTNEINE